MAKGLRNKSKRHFRAIKRNTIFAPVEDARLQRLAARQAEATGNLRQDQLTLSNSTNHATTYTTNTTVITEQTSELTRGTTAASTSIVEVEMIDSILPSSKTKKQDLSGSLLYTALGLLDPEELSVTNAAARSLKHSTTCAFNSASGSMDIDVPPKTKRNRKMGKFGKKGRKKGLIFMGEFEFRSIRNLERFSKRDIGIQGVSGEDVVKNGQVALRLEENPFILTSCSKMAIRSGRFRIALHPYRLSIHVRH
ncbi:hypothetical protein G9A89_005180 [Geosiphon pyriformis]|nr:hypothetical protein G9A89_005180 [Geosiphon pyriformis]